jgi:hypothetical protein
MGAVDDKHKSDHEDQDEDEDAEDDEHQPVLESPVKVVTIRRSLYVLDVMVKQRLFRHLRSLQLTQRHVCKVKSLQ